MGFVDADTHIVEDDMVWRHIPKADQDLRSEEHTSELQSH